MNELDFFYGGNLFEMNEMKFKNVNKIVTIKKQKNVCLMDIIKKLKEVNYYDVPISLLHFSEASKISWRYITY